MATIAWTNLLFADERIWAIDWQTVARGSGIFDLAYFIVGSTREDVDAAAKRRLLACYADTLAEAGVEPPPPVELQRDYGLAKLFSLFMAVAGSDFIDLEGRGNLLLERMWSRTLARIPEPPWDPLLA